MELLWQGLRMSIYGNGDHSGGIRAGLKNAVGRFAGAACFNIAGQWPDNELAATAVEGDTPH